MRINEAYEHEPLLSCGPAEENMGSCSRVGTQCVDVAATLTLVPTTVVGTMSAGP